MSKDAFAELIRQVTEVIGDRPVEAGLSDYLNTAVPADGPLFTAIETACHQGVDEGWMCEREHGGIRYGRVLPPAAERGGYSVDVVRMEDVAGPHHRHPGGEIDMIMPLAGADGGPGAARFDKAPRGWLVYGPDSAHRPTVSDGAALVLYLLPGGQIEFTR